MRAILACLLILLAAGCARGPDTQALQAGVAERLGQALPPGTLALDAFSRRGSQADTKAPAGETRRVVYFDADLKLQKDYEFGSWDSPGVAGLISALGAGPKGITGITAGGNKAGDVLRARGSALYKEEGGKWVAVSSGGHAPALAPAYAVNTPQAGAAGMLDAIRKVMETKVAVEHTDIVAEELAAAHATIRARLARVSEGYAIAAGPEHGQYLRFAHALARSTKVRIEPLVTQGGEENLRLLRSGKVSLALAQGDSARDAYEGKGAFADDGPLATLHAIGSLYPEPVHVLVRASSAVSTVADLRGARIAIGVPGAASRATALRVLQAHGLGTNAFKPVEAALGDALVRLRAGEVDAVVQVIGAPADSIRVALAAVPLRLLPLSENAIAALAKPNSGLFAFSIPAGSYANQAKPVRTVATAALLVASPQLTDSEVATVARFVYARGVDLASLGSAQGAQVSAQNATNGLSIPMHPAAQKALALPEVTPVQPPATPAKKS